MAGEIKEAIGSFSSAIISVYGDAKSIIPHWAGIAFDVLLLLFGIVLASVFVWYFYSSLSKRNLLHINLYKYNRSEYPALRKFAAIFFFFIEYLFLMPLIIIIWFAALSVMLLLINEKYNVGQVLMVGAAVVGAVRILAYYNEDAAEEVAKIVPFTALALFLLSSINITFSQVFTQLEEVPALLGSIFWYIMVVVAVEAVLRIAYTTKDFLESQDELARERYFYGGMQ
jgi:hypothetical protein